MHFSYEQRFTAPVDDVIRAFSDPEMYQHLSDLPRVSRPEVVERREDGDRVHLRLRYRFTASVSPRFRRIIDPDRLSWVEETVFDMTRLTGRFVMRPDHYPDRLSCTGVSTYHPAGDGSLRASVGDLVVRVPLLGSTAERAIVAGLKDHLAKEVPLVERYLAGQRGGG